MAAPFAAVKASSVRGCTCAALAIWRRLSKRASSCQMPSSVRLRTSWSSSGGRIAAARRNGSASGLGGGVAAADGLDYGPGYERVRALGQQRLRLEELERREQVEQPVLFLVGGADDRLGAG